jgi:hypothetical protein
MPTNAGSAGATRSRLMRPPARPVITALLLLAALVVPRHTSGAQGLERDRTAHARHLAFNVALGATVAAARAAITGTPLRVALSRGLVGGSLMSVGMELVGTESTNARIAGVQLAAVGASVSRNVEAGTPMFSDLTLPFYPLYVRIRPGAPNPVTARLSVLSAARLTSVLTRSDRPTVDWGATLATGTAVLASPRWRLESKSCPPPCLGSFAQHNAGVIVYSASAGTDYDLRRTLAHETIHVVQHTRDVVFNAIPASDAVLARAGRTGRTLSRFLVADFLLPLRFIAEADSRLRGARPRESWYEIEARAFAPGGELFR